MFDNFFLLIPMPLMSKKTIFLAIFLLLSAILGGWFLLRSQKDTRNMPEDVDISGWKTYKVGNFTFQMNIPSEISDNLMISEERVKKDHSYYGSSAESILWFSYPLDRALPRSDRDLSLGKLDKMEVWYIDAVPVNDWKEGICDGKPLCRQGRVMARDNSYVFESGFRSVEGAEMLCRDHSDIQKNFCESYKSLIDFVESDRFKVSLGQKK